MLGSQGQRRLEFDVIARGEVKGEVLTHDCRHQNHLHQGEALSDADASAATERQVCAARTVRGAPQKPARIESIRVGPPARVVVNVVNRDDDGGAAANSVSVDDVIIDGLARDYPHRREVALRFLQARGGPGQLAQVVGGRAAHAQHVVQLGEHVVAGLRVQRHQIPEPGHGVGGGFVAGEHERQSFIAYSLAGPDSAVGAQQHVEQVRGVSRLGQSPIDHRVDGAIQGQRDLLHFPQRRRQMNTRVDTPDQRVVNRPRHQPPQPQPLQLFRPPQAASRKIVHGLHQRPEVLAEQGVGDYPQCRLDHALVHVELRAGHQRGGDVGDWVDHQTDESAQVAPGEGRV